MKKKIKKEKSISFLIYFKKFFLVSALVLMFVFLGLNIYFSQNISPLFLKITDSYYPSVVEFLKKIKKTPYFSEELTKFKKIYGQRVVDDVFFEDIEKEKKIEKLKALLKLNPDSRDLLYNLYLLYKEKGDETMAKKYLQKAKAIDPWLR